MIDAEFAVGFVELEHDLALRDGPTLRRGMVGRVLSEERGHFRVLWPGLSVATMLLPRDLRPSTERAWELASEAGLRVEEG